MAGAEIFLLHFKKSRSIIPLNKGNEGDRPSGVPTENAGHRLRARHGKERTRNAPEPGVRVPKGR